MRRSKPSVTMTIPVLATGRDQACVNGKANGYCSAMVERAGQVTRLFRAGDALIKDEEKVTAEHANATVAAVLTKDVPGG